MHKTTTCILAGMLAGVSCQLWADEEEHREHGAHVHGVASMNLAIEAREVVMELVTPAMNIVGFEHSPRDEAERDSVKSAVAVLREGGDWLILPPEAACELENAEVASELLGHEEDDHGESHDAHEEHDHDDDLDEHEAHEGHDDHDEATHSEFHVHYTFHCDNPDEIQAVQVNFFEGFAGMEEIEIQALTETRQIGGTLTADEPVIQIKE